MTVIETGSTPPPIPGVDLGDGPRALFFYKVTCPVCQMAAPLVTKLEASYPGVLWGIGQDPIPRLEDFAEQYGWSVRSTPDHPPYGVSEAYGIRVVPALVLVHGGGVDRVVESWDREGYNGFSSRLAELTGRSEVSLSEEGDGLPSFRPG